MNNNAIADNFSLLSKLMDIHGDNSFKAKSYSSAAFNIEKLSMQLSSIEQEKIFSLLGKLHSRMSNYRHPKEADKHKLAQGCNSIKLLKQPT